MRHLFILDPKDFEHQWKIDSIFDSIGQYFRTQVKPEFSTQMPRYPRETIGHIQKQVDEAKDTDTVRVYAIGSGEILFDCLNCIAEVPNADLAIMPQGNSNDFLRIFGENHLHDFNDIAVVASAGAIPTDIIRVGNVYALNVCSIGLIAVTAKTLKKRTSSFYFFHRVMAFLSNVYAMFNREISARYYKITIDGSDYSGNYSNISIANGPYYGGRKTALKGAVPDDGLLDVALLKTASPLATMFSMLKFYYGKTPSNCVAMQAKKITIQSEVPFRVQMDGEFVEDTNITFEVVPRAIQIVLPGNLTYPKNDSV